MIKLGKVLLSSLGVDKKFYWVHSRVCITWYKIKNSIMCKLKIITSSAAPGAMLVVDGVLGEHNCTPNAAAAQGHTNTLLNAIVND